REVGSWQTSGKGMILSLAFAPDGQSIVVGGVLNVAWNTSIVLRLRRLGPYQVELTEQPAPAMPRGVADSLSFSRDRRLLAVPADGLTVRDRDDAKKSITWKPANGTPSLAALSSDGAMLATGHGSLVEIWQTATGRRLAICEGHTDTLHHLAFSPDGQ